MYQPIISKWIKKLNLKPFPQYDAGNAILDHGEEREVEIRPIPNQQGNMRIEGGSQAFIDALVSRLQIEQINLGFIVEEITESNNEFEIKSSNKSHQTIHADRIIIATPPRIALKTINWKPSLPNDISKTLDMMPTWMAPHAKVSIIYENAFWREQGLSGRIVSRAGPIVETHDHCSADQSTSAIWGFIGWPNNIRTQLGTQLEQHIRNQLKRCFGNNSPDPIKIEIKDWANDPFVTSANDLTSEIHHPSVGPDVLRMGHNQNRIFFAGSETAQNSPGLIEGAFDSATHAVDNILKI